MADRFVPRSGITRRGLLLGAGLIASPFVVRSRPDSIDPITLSPDRSYPRPDLLIAPETLYQRIIVEQQPVRVLDATDLATYRDAHVPGAVHVWWQDTMELNDPFYGKVLKPDDGDRDQGRRVRLLERLGIDPAGEVVICGDTLNMPAARVCWFLRFLGINAAVLDGGRAGWLGIGGPMTGETADVAETSIETVEPRQGFYLALDQVVERLASPSARVVDLRETEERSEGPYRGLDVPGAIQIPRSAFTNGQGSIHGAAEFDQILAATGIDLTNDLLLLAPTGLDAAVPWLALSLLGAESVVIVDGGWAEWIDTPGLPLATTAFQSPARALQMG